MPTSSVEGEEIAYLVLGQDGKVQKLHPAYNLDDESIGETENALVMSMANVDGELTMARYIPGVDDYPYPTWTGDEDLSIDPALLEAIDDNVNSVQVDADMQYEIGAIIYRMAWEIQAVMNEEDLTVSDIRDDLPEVLETLKAHLVELQTGHAESTEDEDESAAEPGVHGEEKSGFVVRQDMLFAAMKLIFWTVCRAVDENDVGDFPFFVLCGNKEVLAVLHDDGELDNLEEDYELPKEAFDQTPNGFTLDVAELLGFPLRMIPVPQGNAGNREGHDL